MTAAKERERGIREMNKRKKNELAAGIADLCMAAMVTAFIYTSVGVIVKTVEKNNSPQEESIEAAAVPTVASSQITEVVKDVYEQMNVPDGDTAFKSYMSYRAITNKNSQQYKLQKKCWTDGNGLRRYKTYYVVALGSYYADNIGDVFKITTEDGNSFECVVGDFKADQHTDDKNQYTPMQGRKCVVEFVVDMQILDRTAKRMGDISYIEGFSGNIESIEKK